MNNRRGPCFKKRSKKAGQQKAPQGNERVREEDMRECGLGIDWGVSIIGQAD